MKVLIVTYYWPPSGGSGVQRWLKFVKYLPEFGIQPIVFTPENPAFELRDESLLKDVSPESEVVHFPIWEPYGLGKKVTGRSVSNTPSNNNKTGFVKKLLTWIRGNLLFPDPRIFWVRPSVQFLDHYIREKDIKIIITTGPPHSMHLIGKRLKKKNNSLKWIADFRDPWSEWGMLRSFFLTGWALAIHKKIELAVLKEADKVITITPFYQRQLSRISNRSVELITNGYDTDDFSTIDYAKSEKFIIRHVGVVNPECDPRPLMAVIKEVCESDAAFAADVEIVFTGQVNENFRAWVKQHTQLNSITFFQSSVPHKEVVQLMAKSEVLMLILHGYKDGEGFLPGKLFEYLAIRRPILAIGPVPGDAHTVLEAQGHIGVISASDVNSIKKNLLYLYDCWKKGLNDFGFLSPDKFSRKGLTFKLAELLKNLN